MKNDTLIRIEGMEALTEKLGMVEAERFIMLIRREPFDYSRWQENLFEGMSIEAISAKAAALRAQTEKVKKVPAKSRQVKTNKKPAGGRKTAKRLSHA